MRGNRQCYYVRSTIALAPLKRELAPPEAVTEGFFSGDCRSIWRRKPSVMSSEETPPTPSPTDGEDFALLRFFLLSPQKRTLLRGPPMQMLPPFSWEVRKTFLNLMTWR